MFFYHEKYANFLQILLNLLKSSRSNYLFSAYFESRFIFSRILTTEKKTKHSCSPIFIIYILSKIVFFYISGDFQKSEHHQKSMEIMKGYQPVKDYLGEPIGASWFDMNEDDNKCDGLNAHVNILYNFKV